MDVNSLINLALVTIVYSTLVGPNIQKLSSMKEGLINISFPKVNSNGASNSKQTGNKLSRQLAIYQSKYKEIKKFLRYFYGIFFVIGTYQILVLVFTQKANFQSVAPIVFVLVVVLILHFALKSYMTPYWLVRSFYWLAQNGATPSHLKQIMNPTLVVNSRASNATDSDEDEIKISIFSDSRISGYRFILTIENAKNSSLLYYVSLGSATKNTRDSDLVYEDGSWDYGLDIGKVSLKEGSYKARVHLLMSPYSGRYEIYEASLDLLVSTDKVATSQTKIKTDSESGKPGYWYEIRKPYKLVKIHSLHNENDHQIGVERLFASGNLVKRLRNHRRWMTLKDIDGLLDARTMHRALSNRNYILKRIKRVLTNKPWKKPFSITLYNRGRNK